MRIRAVVILFRIGIPSAPHNGGPLLLSINRFAFLNNAFVPCYMCSRRSLIKTIPSVGDIFSSIRSSNSAKATAKLR